MGISLSENQAVKPEWLHEGSVDYMAQGSRTFKDNFKGTQQLQKPVYIL